MFFGIKVRVRVSEVNSHSDTSGFLSRLKHGNRGLFWYANAFYCGGIFQHNK